MDRDRMHGARLESLNILRRLIDKAKASGISEPSTHTIFAEARALPDERARQRSSPVKRAGER